MQRKTKICERIFEYKRVKSIRLFYKGFVLVYILQQHEKEICIDPMYCASRINLLKFYPNLTYFINGELNFL